MNSIKTEGLPFAKGFLEELCKIKDIRIEGYIRIIELLNSKIHETSRVISLEVV